jgi:phage terminase large subunit GpA-like protein
MNQAAIQPQDIAPEFSFTSSERRVFKAREKVTVSQHADAHRQVTRGPWKGQWDTANTEYLRFPMDLWNRPWIRKIFMCWAPQTGKTQVALNCLHYCIDQDPDTAFYVMSTEYTLDRIKQKQLDPMIESSPRVSHLVAGDTKNSIQFKNGMDLMMAWATSVAALASESARYMFFDEVDKYDPPINLDLGDIRTNAYPHTKKLLYYTTPEDETRPITQLIREEADVLYQYLARCPMCGHYQVMEFDRIRWPKEIRDTKKIIRGKLARYECEACKNGWTDDIRDQAIRRHPADENMIRWRPFIGKSIFGEFSEPPDRPTAVGLHLPSWNSPFISLSEVVAAFLRGLRDPDKLRIFMTQHKAEPWVYRVKTTTEEQVLKARVPALKPQTVPATAVALTCGIDVQKYGFWFLVRAWARDYTSWMIHYGFLSYWAELEDLLFMREYPRSDNEGSGLRIWRAGIDTGGGKYDEQVSSAEQVYLWLMQNRIGRGCQVWGTKGASKNLAGKISVGKSLQHTPTGKSIPGGLSIISLDTHKLKDTVHFRLDKAMAGTDETAHMAAYLHAGTKPDYASQIMSEVKKQDKKGRETWVQEYRENHLLDCEVIAHALADPEWPGGGVHLINARRAPKKDDSDSGPQTKIHRRPSRW